MPVSVVEPEMQVIVTVWVPAVVLGFPRTSPAVIMRELAAGQGNGKTSMSTNYPQLRSLAGLPDRSVQARIASASIPDTARNLDKHLPTFRFYEFQPGRSLPRCYSS